MPSHDHQIVVALVIRNLRPSDSADIVDYYCPFYDKTKEDPSFGISLHHEKPSLSNGLNWFSGLYKKMADGDAIAMVADMDSHVVGPCEASRLQPSSDLSHRGDLGISVSKDHRGKGVGTALMQETLQRGRGRFEMIEIIVLATNQAAKRLCEKFGFKAFGVRPRSVKKGDKHFDRRTDAARDVNCLRTSSARVDPPSRRRWESLRWQCPVHPGRHPK